MSIGEIEGIELGAVFDDRMALREAGVPCSPVLSLDAIVEDPHVQARGVLSRHHDPEAGDVLQVRSPIGQGLDEMRPAPKLSQHTREVLAEMGFSADEIEGFFRDQVALATPASPHV